jgi:hypothetical protein
MSKVYLENFHFTIIRDANPPHPPPPTAHYFLCPKTRNLMFCFSLSNLVPQPLRVGAGGVGGATLPGRELQYSTYVYTVYAMSREMVNVIGRTQEIWRRQLKVAWTDKDNVKVIGQAVLVIPILRGAGICRLTVTCCVFYPLTKTQLHPHPNHLLPELI